MKMKKILILAVLGLSSVFGFSSEIDSGLVDAIIPEYLNIQDSLAKDSLEQAQASAKELVHLLHHDNHAENPMLHKLMAATKSISIAEQLSDARESFSILSNRLVALLDHVGSSYSGDLYIVRCSMAFEGKGALWVQSSEVVNNPYFGKMMQSCGSIQKKISSK